MHLKLIFIYLMHIGSLSFLQACELPKITKNGGILPYYYDDQTNELHFLLGSENRVYRISNSGNIPVSKYFTFWQDFGGDLELNNQETNPFVMFNACLRETYEELHVLFPSLVLPSQVEQLPLYVQSERYTIFLIRFPTKISTDLLDCYFLSMDQAIGNFIFQTFRGNNQPQKEFDFNEKNEYKWFTLQDIMTMAKNTTDIFLKPLFAQVILNENGYMKAHSKTAEEITAIFKEISDTIQTQNLKLLFDLFIPFFKDSNTDDTNTIAYKSSIIPLINNGLLQKQQYYAINKWFTTLYCLLYRKSDLGQVELFNMQADLSSKENIYFYPMQTDFDTTVQFINVCELIEKELGTIIYNKNDLKKFLQDIHFQINTDSQTAYCALELKEPLPASLEYEYVENQEHIQDHQKYLQSFLQMKQYKDIIIKTMDFHDSKNESVNSTSQFENKLTELTTNNNNRILHRSWSQRIIELFQEHCFLFGGTACAGFLFACFWYIKYLK
jgi:hypothetical protein